MSNDKVNWEQVRVDAAVAAMSFFQQVFKDNYQLIAKSAVALADALIAELKKTNETK